MGISFSFFILFLAAVFLFYFSVPRRGQWIVLLIASYGFYMTVDARMVVVLFLSTLTSFLAGIGLGRQNARYRATVHAPGVDARQKQVARHHTTRRKRQVLAIALLINLGILVILKYGDFIAENIDPLLSWLGLHRQLPRLGLLLPLGISFYTFQSAGYLIDVYRGTCEPDRNPARFALFVSFFPQIVQGPISRYHQLARQLAEPHAFHFEQATFGLQLILWGLFKKFVIADRTAIAVDMIFTHTDQYGGPVLFLGPVLYCLQIYADFSGGMDVARGIAQVMGIHLTENFRRPYFAVSIADFWRRWHITLGAWMRDYVFYPLSLSKLFARIGIFARRYMGGYLGKLLPSMLAMFVTFLAVGAWHGANWTFMAYGAYHGILIFMGMLFAPMNTWMTGKLHFITRFPPWRIVPILWTFSLVCIGRYFSRAPGLSQALHMMKRSLPGVTSTPPPANAVHALGLDQADWIVLFIAVGVLLTTDWYREHGIPIRATIARQPLWLRWPLYLAAILGTLIFGMYGPGYDSAQFIYAGF